MICGLIAGVAVVLMFAAPSAHAQTLSGTDGDDQLFGTSGNDLMFGLGGDDEMNGEAGNDTLDGGLGDDDIAGGTGGDGITYAESTAVRATLHNLANDGTSGEYDNVHIDVENVYGSDGDDDLTGSALASTIDGGAGNDAVDGGGGSDTLFGGEGNDRLAARDGVRDRIDCGAGDDTAVVDERDQTTGCEIVDRRPAVPRVDFE